MIRRCYPACGGILAIERSAMRLIVQPDDGVKPLIEAIDRAKRTVTIVVFRFGLAELENALQAACKRGVAVHALVAHATGKGEKRRRKLQSRLLEYGATVARTDDDMVRYHEKLLLIDRTIIDRKSTRL